VTRRWTSADDLRASVARRWASGELLASVVTGEPTFPLRIRISRPTTEELSDRLADVRTWMAGLRALGAGRVEYKESRTRLLGGNQLPAALVLDIVDDAASLVDGAPAQLAAFRRLVAATSARHPELVPLLARRPFDAIGAADVWDRLLDVVDWLGAHPNPQRYLRQVDLPGVHTKLIEEHARLVAVLCEAACPHTVVDPVAVAFERRFGFRTKPRLVRFRVLDQSLRLSTTDTDGDYTLTAVDFGRLNIDVKDVFVVENEVSFLAFPSCPSAVCVWGAGSGLEHLAMAPWLARARVIYWGDLDTHGFAILEQLRAVLPAARSMLMDRSTFEACQDRWGTEEVQVTRELPLLSAVEKEAYDLLRDQRLGRNLRLEQELIPQHLLTEALRGLPPEREGVHRWRRYLRRAARRREDHRVRW
jgi:hypothetical protein